MTKNRIMLKAKGFDGRGSSWEEVDAIVKRMRQPGYRRINQGLTPNATPLEKSKYDICQNILCYKREGNISEQEVGKKLGLKKDKLEYLLFCHIDKLTLDELVEYASKLFAPFHLEIAPEKSLLFSSKSSNGRVRKHT